MSGKGKPVETEEAMLSRWSADVAAAVRWARDLLQRNDWVILDTETTGINNAEIVQVGILSPAGEVLLDTLVRPAVPIPARATAIHGIADDMVVHAPDFPTVYSQVLDLTLNRTIVTYNVEFDRGVLQGCCDRRGIPGPLCDWHCAMLAYAAYVGEQHGDFGYRWHPLPGAGHRAIDDCRAVLALIKKMAAGTTPDDLAEERRLDQADEARRTSDRERQGYC